MCRKKTRGSETLVKISVIECKNEFSSVLNRRRFLPLYAFSYIVRLSDLESVRLRRKAWCPVYF